MDTLCGGGGDALSLLVMEFLMKTEVSKKLFTVDEWSQDLAGEKPC